MLALHRERLEWLLAGTPPALWDIGCIHLDIHPPQHAHAGQCTRQSITATISLPTAHHWRPERQTRGKPAKAIASTIPLPRNSLYNDAPTSADPPSAPKIHIKGSQATPEAHRPPPIHITPARDSNGDPTLPKPKSPAALSWRGLPSPTQPNPYVSSERAPLPPPSLKNTATIGFLTYCHVLSRGAIRFQFAMAKRRDTIRRRMNNAKR